MQSFSPRALKREQRVPFIWIYARQVLFMNSIMLKGHGKNCGLSAPKGTLDKKEA